VKFAVIDTESAKASVEGLVEEIGVSASFKAKKGGEV
jgi:hypothetical protein